MFVRLIIVLMCFSISKEILHAQGTHVNTVIADSETRQPLSDVTVSLSDGLIHAITNSGGRFNLVYLSDSATLKVSHIGYEAVEIKVWELPDTLFLSKVSLKLKELEVNAVEDFDLQNTTIINAQASQYLQPASLKDLFQLLPGNLTENPNLSNVNIPLIREIDYSTTNAFGTSIIVDGNQLYANAGMQSVNFNQQVIGQSYPVGTGQDLRTIPTEFIEKMTLIKGIPSVRYGDMTNAVVDVKTRLYNLGTDAKVKYSPTLFTGSLSKNLSLSPDLNAGAILAFTSSPNDTRNPLIRYNRLTFTTGTKHRLSENQFLKTKLDYYYTLNQSDNNKIYLLPEEKYTQQESGLRSSISYESWNTSGIIRKFHTSLNTNIEWQNHKNRTYSSFSEAIVYTLHNEPGLNRGFILPGERLREFTISGIPFSTNLSTFINLSNGIPWITSGTLAGFEAKFEKNYGKGIIYDTNNPPIVGLVNLRQHAFKEIPGLFTGAFYLEQELKKTVKNHTLELRLGARQTLYNIDQQAFKTFTEPRFNGEYRILLPQNTVIALHGGMGVHYKIPLLRHLHPGHAWFDMLSINKYNTVQPDSGYFYFTTQKISTQNPNLKPAKSVKKEIGISFKNKLFNLMATYFKENHTDGIALTSNYSNFNFRTYDHNFNYVLTRSPEEQGAPYTNSAIFNPYYVPENRRSTIKEGIEFALKTKKIETIQTSIYLSGAWFNTSSFSNTLPYNYLPPSSTQKQYDYIGIYENNHAKVSERLSSNLRFITHIPQTGMFFSFSVQTIWKYQYRFTREKGIPVSIIDREGISEPFAGDMLNDPYFQAYIITPADIHFQRETFPVTSQVNFKLAKEIGNYTKISFLANNILNYRPLVKLNSSNTFIRMNTPIYFGLDLTISLK